jgi:heat shock protein HtpX
MAILMLVLVNFAVMSVIYITTTFMGFESLAGEGSQIYLLFVSAIFGFGGSIISLLMSKKIVKMTMDGYREIKADQQNNDFERWYVQKVKDISKKAKIKTPEIGIFEGSPNAFATGPSRNNSLVAISTGLIKTMSRDEIEGVIGHEIAHVSNGDMVTLTLIQGTMNTFVFYLARIFTSRDSGMSRFISIIIFEILLGFVANIIVAWFSRYREYRADIGSVQLTSRNKMLGALQALENQRSNDLPEEMKVFGFNSSEMMNLFSTHPPLAKRIEALIK